MIEEGVYTDLSSEDYHSDKQSISRSSLLDFKKNARNYWAKHLDPNRPPAEKKESLIFGTAFHTLIIESHLIEQNYLIMPEKVLKRDNKELFYAHKQAKKEAENTTKIVLSLADYKRLCAMRESLYANQRAKELIEGASYESSYFWQDQHSGLMLKARPDILHSNIYVDLKTIDDASPENYQREMVKYGYHIQAAMIKDGVFQLEEREISAFINVCVEKTYPYLIGVYMIDEAAIEHGHCEYKQTCLDLKTAIAANEFKDYCVQKIGLPKWMI